MTVSLDIIIPVLNEAEHVEELLTHLHSLRQEGVRLIVVDGGSYDATVRLAQGGADTVLVSKPGRSMQMNLGANHAQAEWLMFLHADTRLPQNALDALNEATRQNEKEWGRFNLKLSGRQPLLRLVERMINVRSWATGIATGDQAIFVKRSAFEQAGGFPAIPLMEDVAFSKAMKKLSRPVCIQTPVITDSRRWEQRGIVKTILLMWQLRALFYFGVSPDKLHQRYYPEHKHKILESEAKET